jgi:hypothetical protein
MEHIVAHVANQIQLPHNSPIQITETAKLRAATTDEIEEYDKRLALATAATSVPTHSYRHSYESKIEKGSTSFVPTALTTDKWRYFVVDFIGDGLDFLFLEQLLILTDPPIYLSFCVYTGVSSPLAAVRPLKVSMLERAHRIWWDEPNGREVDRTQISELNFQLESIKHTTSEYKFVREAVAKYFDLQRLPPLSDMYLLGLFSIIESLIAHKPRLAESLDSINHQLANKLALLDECMLSGSIKAFAYFPGVSNQKIWKKLYAYRSQLAHTSSSAFPLDLSALKSKDDILRFVNAKTKELIRFGIAQPKFLMHLKEC